VDGEASRELLARNPPTPSGDPSPVQSPLKVMTAGYRPDAELAAIQSARKGEVISAPTLITANRQEAKIEQGIELPSAERMVLTVTSRPVITPDGRIQVFLTLRRESDKPGPVTGGSDARPDVRQISTQALINDGQTLVLSGLMPPATSSNAQDTKSNKQDLLVFLTSRIVAEDASRNF
jgi:type IV pilus assembly protein PilQ